MKLGPLSIYLIIINIITFILYAVDKFKAIKGKWRISELMLLGFAFFGGSLGGLVAMYVFRHKTKKAKFTFGVPIMLIVQFLLIAFQESLISFLIFP